MAVTYITNRDVIINAVVHSVCRKKVK